MEAYAPREIRFHGLRAHEGWRLKVYSVAYGDRPVDWNGFEAAMSAALDSLPPVDAASGRPGVGFLIAHQGKSGDYTVLAWWDHENELPLRVWVRRDHDEPWRPARDGESICVWDLEVIAAEREAWIATMMTGGGASADDYLARVDLRFATEP